MKKIVLFVALVATGFLGGAELYVSDRDTGYETFDTLRNDPDSPNAVALLTEISVSESDVTDAKTYIEKIVAELQTGDNIVVHRNVSTAVTFQRLLTNHVTGGTESPNHAMWLIASGTYTFTGAGSITYNVKPNQFYYVAPRSNQAHLLVDLSDFSGGGQGGNDATARAGVAANAAEILKRLTETQVDNIVNTAILNGIQEWALAAPNNQDNLGNQIYPAADVLADAAQHDYPLLADRNGTSAWRKLPEGGLADAVVTKLDATATNSAAIATQKERIDQIARHGTADNIRMIPSGGDRLTRLVGTHSFQMIDPAAAPDGAVAVTVQVGVTGSDLGTGSAVALLRNWTATSTRTFTISQSQYDVFNVLFATDARSVEFRFRFYAAGAIDDSVTDPGRVSLGAAIATEIVQWYIGAHDEEPATLLAAVDGSDTAGDTSVSLNASVHAGHAFNWRTYDTLRVAIWVNNRGGNRIVTGSLPVAVIAAQTANRNFVVGGNPATGDLTSTATLIYHASNQTMSVIGGSGERIIFAQLRN